MITNLKTGALFLLLLAGRYSYANTLGDSTELISEFRRVMSFATKPYVYFTTVTKITSSPVFQEEDTLNLKGIFYKNETNLYYSSGQEEVYLQDSFMIKINQKRKSIWISKIDVASKEKISVLPVSNEQLQELFSKKYSVKKTRQNLTSTLNFEAKQKGDSIQTITSTIIFQYGAEDYLPMLMEVDMRLQQPLNAQMLSELKDENIESAKLVQDIKGTKYLMRQQKMSVLFNEISNTKEKAGEMPSWKSILDYDAVAQEFGAKGLYKDFEIAKTF